MIPVIGAAVLASAGTVAIAGVGTYYGVKYAAKYTKEGIVALNDYISQLERDANARKATRLERAKTDYLHLTNLCEKTIAEIRTDFASQEDQVELQELIDQLVSVLDSEVPEDGVSLQNLNEYGFSTLKNVLNRKEAILKKSNITIETDSSTVHIIDSVISSIKSERILDTFSGADIIPEAVDAERAELFNRLQLITCKVRDAMGFFSTCAHIGLPMKIMNWYDVYFGNIEGMIEETRSEDIPNDRLKKILCEIEDIMNSFDTMYPDFRKEIKEFIQCYNRYASLAAAFQEEVLPAKAFKDTGEIKKELERLERKVERLHYCEKLYKKLGSAHYTCMAYDEELRRMGYTVFGRENIENLAENTFDIAHDKINGKNTPFYSWIEEGAKTQLYELDNGCILQLIVHADGTTTMETIAADDETAKEAVTSTQSKHCSKLKTVQQRLKDNWFIDCNFREEHDAERLYTASDWRNSIRAEQNQAAAAKQPASAASKKSVDKVQYSGQ